MRHAGALLAAVAAFVAVKVLLKLAALNETAELLATAVAAAVIAGIFTRHVGARRRGS